MPPSKHSGSSMSAHKDSDQIPNDQNYALGEYSFRIERTSVPGSTNDKIEAICTDKDGKNARKSIQVPSSANVDGWYVEANEDTADVYAIVDMSEPEPLDLDISPWVQPILLSDSFEYITSGGYHYRYVFSGVLAALGIFSDNSATLIFASSSPGGTSRRDYYDTASSKWIEGQTTTYNNPIYTHNDKPVYGAYSVSITIGELITGTPNDLGVYTSGYKHQNEAAWVMVYENEPIPEGKKDVLIGRFAINLEDAGGVGPGGGTGGGWTDPEDYDEDWEEGDPTHTLYVTVTGALSGRHNDPIEDPSYSYIPADKDTVKDYGCGGDGGHGGGGGAGASTVVIHKFATNQANSKEVTAIARRHGYGSGGGKGGKGGDGCILVYY